MVVKFMALAFLIDALIKGALGIFIGFLELSQLRGEAVRVVPLHALQSTL